MIIVLELPQEWIQDFRKGRDHLRLDVLFFLLVLLFVVVLCFFVAVVVVVVVSLFFFFIFISYFFLGGGGIPLFMHFAALPCPNQPGPLLYS